MKKNGYEGVRLLVKKSVNDYSDIPELGDDFWEKAQIIGPQGEQERNRPFQSVLILPNSADCSYRCQR